MDWFRNDYAYTYTYVYAYTSTYAYAYTYVIFNFYQFIQGTKPDYLFVYLLLLFKIVEIYNKSWIIINRKYYIIIIITIIVIWGIHL
jgi:hypothetical protein